MAGLAEREQKRKSTVSRLLSDTQPEEQTHVMPEPVAPAAETPKPAKAKATPKASAAPVLDESLGFLAVREKPEPRNRRTNFALRASIHAKAMAKSKRMGTTLNDVVNQFLEEFVKDE